MLSKQEPNPGMVCIKYILVIFNFIFVVTGICLFLVGWSINYVYYEYSEFLEAHFFSPGFLMIAIGVLVFAVACFGCLGAYKESTCMIYTFSVLLGVIFGLEMAAGLSAYALQSQIHGILQHTITQALHESPKINSSARMMDVLQTELHCCGVYSFTDWDGVYPANGTSLTLPDSCCEKSGDDLDSSCSQVYQRGCLPQLETFIRESIVILAGTACTLALIQLIGFSFSCSLAKMLRMQKKMQDRQRWEMREQLINSYTQGEWNLMPDPVLEGYENLVLRFK